MKTWLKQIRKTQTKEEYLRMTIQNLENLISFCAEKPMNNVDQVFSLESGGTSKFSVEKFKKIRNDFNIENNIFLFNQNSLNYANVLWEIIVKIEYSETYGWPIKNIFDLKNKNFNFTGVCFSAIIGSIDESEYYLVDFDWNNGFQFTDEKYLIDTVDSKCLAELFYLYRNSREFKEKENHISAICKKVIFLFQAKDSQITFNFIESKLGNKEVIEFCGKMHGYFRHTSNDSAGKEAKEWTSFDEDEKLLIMEETFVQLLYILSLLRIKELLPEIT